MSFDRYVYSGTNVLVNKFGIMDANKLAAFERRYTSVEIADLRSAGVTGRFDIDHLKSVHVRIFGSIYDWAGAFRDIQIWKGGAEFTAPDQIPLALEKLFGRVRQAGYFLDLPHDETANVMADVMADLNQIHPFREGNGRTQRIFMGQLALNAGYDLDFTKMSENDMRNASMAVSRGNRNLMQYLFRSAMSDRIYDKGPVCVEQNVIGIFGGKSGKTGTLASLFRMMAGRREDNDGPFGPEL